MPAIAWKRLIVFRKHCKRPRTFGSPDPIRAEQRLKEGQAVGTLVLAAHNAPDEWVFSGSLAALDSVARRGGFTRLKVAGAWHSPFMQEAMASSETLLLSLGHLAPTPDTGGGCRCVSNGTGLPVPPGTPLAELLARQLVQPVDWVRTLHSLLEEGVTDVVTVGPGRILRGLVQKTLGGQVSVHETPDARCLTSTLEALCP